MRQHRLGCAVVINHHIGARNAFGVGELRIEAAFGGGARHVVALHGAGNGGLALDDDHPNFIAVILPARFKQYGGFQHDHVRRTSFLDPRNFLNGQRANRRPYNVGQLFEFRRFTEHPGAQRLAVYLAAGGLHIAAKGCNHLRMRGRARLISAMAQHVGINDMRALLLEKARRRGFARRHAAG